MMVYQQYERYMPPSTTYCLDIVGFKTKKESIPQGNQTPHSIGHKSTLQCVLFADLSQRNTSFHCLLRKFIRGKRLKRNLFAGASHHPSVRLRRQRWLFKPATTSTVTGPRG